MKKILTILALMIATVAVVATGYTLTRPAKAAGDVSNFNGKVSWTGTITGKGSNTTDVTVTDKGDGLYDICIKKLTVYGRDSEITFTNVPGTAQGEGVVFSTNGQNSTYTVNSAWGDQIAMTVEGKMLGDQLYVFCSGKVFGWSDDPFTITYGEDFEIPAAPAGASYNFNGNIAWKGNVTGKGNNTTDISITEKGNGLYDINIKKITIYSRDTEITFTNVPGTAQGEGVVFSTNGQNSTYTVNSAWGDQVAMTVEGKMLGDQLYLFCSGKVFGWSDDPFTLTYGEDFEMPAGPGAEPTATYTDKVVSTFYGANENTFENSKVDVYETGENKYKFIIRQYQIASYLLGDFTAVDVAGTPNADGSVSYSFNGMAKASNIGAQAGSFGIGEGTEAELNFEGKSKDGKLYINGIFKIAGADATYVFGEEIKDPEPEPTPVVYNDKASSLFMGTSTNFDEASVEVYEAAGTNKFVVKQVKVSSNLIADFTVEGVTGTTNEDGSISYAFEGNAKTTNIGSVAGYLGFTEGGEAAVTFNGKCKDGKLYLTLTFNVNGSDAVYTFGTEIKDPEPGQEEVPGTKVGEDNYAPNGVKFTWSTPIDWNTQKLVAAIDLSGCKGGTTDENILSVGSEIGEWAAAPHLHLYYTSGTKSLNFNFMAKGSTSNIDNRSRYDVILTDDILVIELSKEKGLVINGTPYLNKYATSEQYADIDAYLAATSDFWALTNIDLGCQQGNPSYATYKYIRVQNLESTPEPAKPVVYTDAAKVTFGGSTVDLTDQTVEITATGENLYTVAYKNLTVGTTQIGDFTAENVEGVEDAEGNINYTFEGEATMSNINPTYGTMFTEGQKVAFAMTGSSKGGKLVAKFTATVLGQEAKILYGGYEEGGETPDQPGVYTDKFVYTISDYATSKDEFSVTVTDNGDGTYKFELPGVGLYNVVFPAVPGTVNEDGSIIYKGTNLEGTLNEDGDKCVMNFLGKSENGKLCFVAEGKIMEFDGVNKFEFGDLSNLPVIKPDVPGIKVGEDGYQPAGEKFAWNTAIDWNTQKLVASINVAGCTGENEGILSVGDAIDAWPGTHFHLYYTRSNNTLQVNYLDATGNPIRKDVEVAGDELLIEISKAAGITVNGESVNYLNESGELTEDYTVYNALWALTEISVGSQEGNGRSNATYNYVRIQEVPVTVTESESFTDDLTVTEPSTKTKTSENKKLDINTYSDETYGLTIYNVEGETANLGDITIKGLNVKEEEGIKYYNADAKATVNGEEMSVTVAGVKYADGKVWFQFELLTANEDLYFIEFGHKQKEGREFGEGKAYKGQWAISQPSATFNGTVDVILQEDGKYALRVHDFQLDGNVVPTFVIPDLVGSEEEGKLYINQMSNVPVYYEATDGDDAGVVADEKKVTYVEFITVTSEGEDDLSISISYVGYGDGANDYVTNANFATLTNGINSINAAAQNGKADIYTINGAKVNAMQKGINIVRMNNKTTKIVKK